MKMLCKLNAENIPILEKKVSLPPEWKSFSSFQLIRLWRTSLVQLCAISVRLLLTGDHIIIINFRCNITYTSMAYKTINLKEPAPASLLFCCYLCAKGQQPWTAFLHVQPPLWNRSLPSLACQRYTRSAITISPTCWWISSYQCSLVQIKPSKASWDSVGTWAKSVRLLFSKLSMNNSCRSLHWQFAAGGGRVVHVSNLFHWHSWIWERMSTCSLLTHVFAFYVLTNAWWRQKTTSLTKRNKLCISVTRIRFIRLCYFPSHCE